MNVSSGQNAKLSVKGEPSRLYKKKQKKKQTSLTRQQISKNTQKEEPFQATLAHSVQAVYNNNQKVYSKEILHSTQWPLLLVEVLVQGFFWRHFHVYEREM